MAPNSTPLKTGGIKSIIAHIEGIDGKKVIVELNRLAPLVETGLTVFAGSKTAEIYGEVLGLANAALAAYKDGETVKLTPEAIRALKAKDTPLAPPDKK